MSQINREELCQDKVLLSVCTMDWCDLGVEFAKTVFPNLQVVCWDPGDAYPTEIDEWEGDWIISYRGDLIIPERVYKKAKKGAMNFHPAPPWYRGLGSQHYAIFNNEEKYGSTCHHLATSVDTGPIIDAQIFSITPGATASSLRRHVGSVCLQQFVWIVSEFIAKGEPLPKSVHQWGERLHLQKEINAWIKSMKVENPDHRCMR